MNALAINGSRQNALAYILRTAREKTGRTQEDIAQYMRWKRPTLSAIEAGHRKVSAHELEQFANLYGTTVSDLLQASKDVLNGVSFLTLEPKQKEMIERLIEMKPRKTIVRSLQLVGVPQEDLEEIASALIHHLLEAAESEVTQ